MNEHLDAYIEHLRRSGASPGTLKSYRIAVSMWIKAGCPEAGEWMSHLFDTLKPGSANTKRYALIGFHKWLISQRLAESNPFADHTSTVKEPQRSLRVLTIKEIAQLIDGCSQVGENPERLGAMVALVASAGLRVSEVINLRADRVDLEERWAWVIGKGDKERMVRFGVVAQEKIRDWLAVRPDAGPYLFCTSTGTPVSDNHFREDLEKAAWWADLKDVNPHLLRHSFATISIQARVPIEDVQGMLGHSSIVTTQRYIHRDNAAAWAGYDDHPLSKGGAAA